MRNNTIFKQKVEKNSCFKPLTATIMLFLILCLTQFSMVSAFEFDNTKIYDKELKEVTIKNTFGLGSEVAKIKLTSELNVIVPRGYQKVAEFELEYYLDSNGGLDLIEFYDKKKSMEKVDIQFDYKIKGTEQIVVNDYTAICSLSKDTKVLNETNQTETCEEVLSGNHTEERITWSDFNKETFEKNKKVTIGVFTDVQKGDYKEWIPTFYGVKIPEWSSWTESLNTGLFHYYRMNDTNVVDEIFNNNGTNNGTSAVTGKIEKALEFSPNDYIPLGSANDFFGGLTDATVSIWLYNDDDWNLRCYMMSSENGLNNDDTTFTMSMWVNDGGTIKTRFKHSSGDVTSQKLTGTQALFSPGTWYHLVTTLDSNYGRLYINGLNVANTSRASATAINSGTNTFTLGRLGTYDYGYWDGRMDEIGMWNRSLSDSEVKDLYNGGDGITYSEEEPEADCTFSGYVKDEDGAALVGANVTIWNQFNVSEYYSNTTIAGGKWSLDITNSTNTYMAGAYYNNSLIGQLKQGISGTC